MVHAQVSEDLLASDCSSLATQCEIATSSCEPFLEVDGAPQSYDSCKRLRRMLEALAGRKGALGLA